MRNYQYFFISINNKQSLKGVIQDAEYEIDVFQNFFYITVQLLYTIAQNPRKILSTELSCIHLDRQSCLNVDTKYMWSRIDVVLSSKRRHVFTWLIQACNFTKERVFVFLGLRSLAWLPALARAPRPGPKFVFTGPGPQFVFTDSDPQFLFTPILYLPA